MLYEVKNLKGLCHQSPSLERENVIMIVEITISKIAVLSIPKMSL